MAGQGGSFHHSLLSLPMSLTHAGKRTNKKDTIPNSGFCQHSRTSAPASQPFGLMNLDPSPEDAKGSDDGCGAAVWMWEICLQARLL